jgi:hypothetical protein
MTEEQQPSLPPMIDKIGITMVQYPDMVKMQEIIEEKERESAENEKIYKEAMEKRKQKARESVNPDDTEEEINRRKMKKTLHRINKNNQNNNEE